jgi:hypothetical protein
LDWLYLPQRWQRSEGEGSEKNGGVFHGFFSYEVMIPPTTLWVLPALS